jgi:hypothetical protein
MNSGLPLFCSLWPHEEQALTNLVKRLRFSLIRSESKGSTASSSAEKHQSQEVLVEHESRKINRSFPALYCTLRYMKHKAQLVSL